MSKRRERIAAIIQTLQVQNAATIRELAGQLDVSDMTIRRDLNLLVQDNIIRLVHSGAVLNPGSLGSYQPRYSLAEAGTLRVEAKMAIGRKAASLIEDGDIVIIDSGSTTECLAKNIQENVSLTVLCFALNVLLEMHRRNKCSLLLAGGTLHENSLVVESPEGVELIKRFRANRAFLSASGVSDKLGVTCTNRYEIEVKKATIQSSLERVLLADSSKFGKIQAAYFAELNEFTAVVTDSGISPEYREIIRNLGIDLYVV